MNINKLKGKIVEHGLNIQQVAKIIGINPATLYRKLKDNGTITVKEAYDIGKCLELNDVEMNEIFFADFVA